MQNTIETSGFLLKIIWLANDDARLTFLTADLGKIEVFASKLARSKKKRAEIDWFRSIRLTLQVGRGSFKLKSVLTEVVWSVPTVDYEIFTAWLKSLDRIDTWWPVEKIDTVFYNFWHQVFAVMPHTPPLWLLAFSRVKLLKWSGFCPRFDILRGDVYFDPVSLEFFDHDVPQARIAINNQTRQVLEFLRRSSLAEFLEKCDNLPINALNDIDKIQTQIENCH